MGEKSLKELVAVARDTIGQVGRDVKSLMKRTEFQPPSAPTVDVGEMRANVMLAFRHLEDARMRLGKVLQAQDGGVSCYDK